MTFRKIGFPTLVNFRIFLLFLFLLTFLSSPAFAAPAPAMTALRYRWTPGQTLRYVVQRDPYFTAPADAIETTDPNAPYRPPVVERLTEEVLAVGRDGAATVRLTLSAEPGFEDAANPLAANVQTVTVSPLGQMISAPDGRLSPEMLAAIFRLPAAPMPAGGPFAVITQEGRAETTKRISSGHDGLLLQTTRSLRRDRVVFDRSKGQLRRRTVTITGSLSLTMIRPPQRGVDDFGHVVPNLPIFQTLTIEQKEEPPFAPASPAPLPSRASTARQSKN